jgi:hypothetical protein
MQQPATGMGFVMFWEDRSSCGGIIGRIIDVVQDSKCVACDFVYFLIFNLVMFTFEIVAVATKYPK